MPVLRLAWFVLAGAAVAVSAAGPEPAAAADTAKMPLALKVVGTRILNSKDEPVLLRGVNTASLEWTSNGEGHILQSVKTAIRDWGVNVIRLPLAQDRWFGKAPEQKDEGVAYRALVREIVEACATQSCYVVLDLHWSDCGEWGTNIAQHSMPDQNSVTFWKDCAAAYRNHPAVIYDLYNEPHDVTWDVWLNGGTITDTPNTRRGGSPRTFDAVGMQKLLDTVRGTGAKNLVIAGGLDWAYAFSGILEGRQLADPGGNGVLYANHAYNNKGHSVETWIARMEQAAAKLPVIVAEYGGSGGPRRRAGRFGPPAGASSPTGDDWLLHAMQALQDHHWSWIAWDFHPAAGPTLIAGWDYTPTPDFGVFVKQALAGTLPRYTPPVAVATPIAAPQSSPPVSARPSAATPSAGNDIAGRWKAEFDTQVGHLKYTFEFRTDGDRLAGRAFREREGETTETDLKEGRVGGAAISFVEPLKFQDRDIRIEYQGKIVGDEIKFTRQVGDFATTELVARREKAAAPLAAGQWKAEFDTQIGRQSYLYEFKVEGDKLTGRALGDIAGAKSETEIGQGKVNGGEISFVETVKFQGQEIPIHYQGTILGDEIKFTRTLAGSITEEMTAKRVKETKAK